MRTAWAPLGEALDRAVDTGRTIRVWLRDDDCVAPTPALDRLAKLCDGVALPVLLAVIPEPADAALAGWIADHAGFTPCQHGVSHANHAPPGERAIELGGTRPLAAIIAELSRGRANLKELFGTRLSDILVPPWNRIDRALVPHLPALGFAALSTIAPNPSSARRALHDEASSLVSLRSGEASGGSQSQTRAIPSLDCDLDIMDWRHGRIGRPIADVAGAAARIASRQDRLGLLTHHLAHDEGAWAVLAETIECLAAHPAVRWASAAELIGQQESEAL